MRVLSLLTHSTTLLVLQQTVIIWFLVDFFLARESATSNKLFEKHGSRSNLALNTIDKIEAVTKDLKKSLGCNDSLTNVPTFDKVILVVIDALGSEFIATIGENKAPNRRSNLTNQTHKMPFLERSLLERKAMGFVAKAATPTVTMPRIKALVSGSIPSFVDVIYNIANDRAEFNEDNLLSLAKSKGKSIVFYGDDTWLSLFNKSLFKRFRETSSLFASDYTSVDTNVTEMALPETSKNLIDWDLLVLHYLGLDHIGHVFGTNSSPLIDKKLIEMDSVLEKIHGNMAIKNHKTLIVVCGDHGMSREGNHGGDSSLESETAMVFLPINSQFDIGSKPQKQHRDIAQIDLAITLTMLTGLPVPSTSRGVMIEPLLRIIWRDDLRLLTCSSIENLKQLSTMLGDDQLGTTSGLGNQVHQMLIQMSKDIHSDSEQSLTQQNLILARKLQAHLTRVVASKSNNLLVVIALTFVMVLSLMNLRKASYRLLLPLMSNIERTTCLGAVLVPIILLNSTDFIEFEHVFWSLYVVAVFVLFCLIALRTHPIQTIVKDIDRLRVVVFAITLLTIILWNHINIYGNERSWLLPTISIIILCNHTRQTNKLSRPYSLTPFIFGALVLTTKFVEEASENHHRVALLQLITFVILLVAGSCNLYISFKRGDTQPTAIVLKLATYWMWWVFLLSRSRNYPFLISNVMMETSLNSLANSFYFNPITRAILYLLCANNAFYGQGNTNLFSSLDIKPAFFGQTQYSLLLAVPLIACSTFGCHIYWYLKLFQRVQGEKEQERMTIRPKLIAEVNKSGLIPEGTKDAIKDFVDMRNFLTIGYYMYVCMVLRDHLFIWSVLSPKLVYLFMTTLTIRLVTSMISSSPYLIVRFSGFGNALYKSNYKAVVE